MIGVVLGAGIAGFGALFLVRGVPPGMEGQFSPRFLRVAAGFQIPLGVAIALAFFFVDADGANAREEDGWGGAFGIATMVVFVAVAGGIAVHNLRKYREAERRRPPRRRVKDAGTFPD